MDSKKLFKILMDGSNPNILDYVDDASEAIKELLIENQSLRIAANGFKDQAKKAEERAEKAKMKLDSAIEQLHGYCHACKNYTQNHNEGPCKTCKHEYFHCRDEKAVDNWKWLGEKEE